MMERHRTHKQALLPLSLDGLVPKNHLLRRIANAIDFSFIYELARPYYSYTGQPSIDPVVLFKTLLVGYLYGITSERRLMEEIQDNLAYRWFLGYDLDERSPDHSVLSKARVRFGPDVFEAFFNQTVQLCQAAGLVRGEATLHGLHPLPRERVYGRAGTTRFATNGATAVYPTSLRRESGSSGIRAYFECKGVSIPE